MGHDVIPAPSSCVSRWEQRHTQNKWLAHGLGKLSVRLFFAAKLNTKLKSGVS